MSVAAYVPLMRAARDVGPGPARLLWRDGAWHRLAPLVQGWAAAGVPLTLGLSGDDVDDIVAHVLVRALVESTPPDHPANWCGIVAKRKALDTLKRRQTVSLELVAEVADEPYDLAGELQYRAQVGRLRAALRRLPDPIRRVVVLHWLHGQEHQTIAEALGITVGACKMRASRGIRLLRGIFEITPTPELSARGVPPKPLGRPPRPVAWRELPQNSGTNARHATPRAAYAAGLLLGVS